MTGLSEAMASATKRLANISDTPRLDAELLMAHALGVTREQLLLRPPGDPPPDFDALLERRIAGEPIAYIVGRRSFWTIELEVGPGALIPRPDSETLIASAVGHFRGSPGPKRILDLGTGPGTLLLAALDEWPRASGVGIDRSAVALGYARRNARRVGVEQRAELRSGDWAEGVEERFDLVLCNPPYVATGAELGPGVIEHEPDDALFAGVDGLDAYRELAPQIAPLLTPNGLAAIEIGFDQAEPAVAILRRGGLCASLARDLAGRPRAILLTGT